MDLWKTFDLTAKTLQQFVKNVSTVQRILEDKEKAELFFSRFPFEKLLNVTLMDGDSLMLSIKILDLFSDYEDFYNNDERFDYTVEFILINLTNINDDCNEILSLFQLLLKILCRGSKSMDDSFKNVFDRERILEVMIKMCRFKIVQKSNFIFYAPLLNYLLDTNFPDSLNRIVFDLFQKLTEYGALMELVVIANLILKSKSKLLNELFQGIWEWLINKSLELFTGKYDEDLVLNLIDCLSKLHNNCGYLKNNAKYENLKLKELINSLYKNLTEIASDICLYTANSRLRVGSFKLLEFMLAEFFDEEKLPHISTEEISNQFSSLSEDVERWPQSDCDIFLCICHMCILYSRMLWKKQDVLNSVTRCFYYRRQSIGICVLKSLYFLYPVLTDGKYIDFYTRTLGDDLLNYFKKLCTISHLYSYNSHQLKWMLEKAPKSIKMFILSQWMDTIENEETREEMLMSVIETCKAERVLLALILDNTLLGKNIGLKSALLLRKMANNDVSRDVALVLPLTVDKPTIFRNLIIAEPGIPLDSSDCVLICSVMGAVIPTLNDSEVLKGACTFSSKLLASSKDDPCAIKEFCRNTENLRYLIDTIDKVDDSTAVEIIRLLKVIILIQQRNKIEMKYNLKEDFKVFIKGSTEKIGKSLKLLYYVLTCKYSLITVDARSVLAIYHVILDYGLNFALQALVYDCIIILLKRLPWLAQTVSSSIHIEMACLSVCDSEYNKNLVKMLDVWLTVIRKEPYNGFCSIPVAAIKSFILRASFSKYETQQYLTIIEDLLKRECYQC